MNKQQLQTFTPFGLLSLKIAAAIASTYEFKFDRFGQYSQEAEIDQQANYLAERILKKIPESKIMLIIDFASAVAVNKSVKSVDQYLQIIYNYAERIGVI